MYGPFRIDGQLIALTLALPFLILTLPMLVARAWMRPFVEDIGMRQTTLNSNTRPMQRVHRGRVRMDRTGESLELLLHRGSLCPTEHFGRDWSTPVVTRTAPSRYAAEQMEV